MAAAHGAFPIQLGHGLLTLAAVKNMAEKGDRATLSLMLGGMTPAQLNVIPAWVRADVGGAVTAANRDVAVAGAASLGLSD